ncbi:MAG TPA: acyl carrier protein [Clostridia bacterium]|nr:acyl carrier protein [Clostridia bacterium]
MKEKLMSLLEETIGKQLYKRLSDLDPMANLFDYGLDSIGFINIIVALEREFNIFIDEDDLDLDRFNNISYIENYVLQKLSKDM